ncbi:MAG: hypothetical protein ACRDSZ_01965 [Pseudonocardiaceae bacterium]
MEPAEWSTPAAAPPDGRWLVVTARGSAPSALIRELVVAFLDNQPVEPTITTAAEVLRQVVLGQAHGSTTVIPQM